MFQLQRVECLFLLYTGQLFFWDEKHQLSEVTSGRGGHFKFTVKSKPLKWDNTVSCILCIRASSMAVTELHRLFFMYFVSIF